ncbi:MAG: ABC transporter ATP-binding protein [Pseudomonadota bacterium]
MEGNEYILEIRGLAKAFGALRAVDRVNITVSKGEMAAIIGPNGAGKTTLFNLITGTLKPTSGEILFKGKNIARLPPHEICRRGIVRTYQITQIFPKLTVLENVRLAVQFKRKGASFKLFRGGGIQRDTEKRSEEVLSFLGLTDIMHTPAEHLSHGDQRLIEISMALAQEPEVLLLDEPTAGLSVEETHRTMGLLKSISEKRENTILLVEHDMDVVFYLAERIIVLNFGQIIAEGSKEDIQRNEKVQTAYLGGL